LSTSEISSGEVRSIARLYRTRADCFLACELYEDGREAEAKLRSTRPITDVLPWLENELRGRSDVLKQFTRSLGAFGAAVRHAAPAADVRVAAKRVEKATEAVAHALVGDRGSTKEFRASVARDLVDESARAYERTLDTHKIDDYQAAQSALVAALELLEEDGPEGDLASIGARLAPLESALKDFDPPGELPGLDEIQTALDDVNEHFEAVGAGPHGIGLNGEIDRIGRLLEDVVSTYAEGQGAVAGRAAAFLFIYGYDPIRAELARDHPDVETELTQILGTDIRVRINDGAAAAEVLELAARARRLLDSTAQSDGPTADR
jgi:hypothetical protein